MYLAVAYWPSIDRHKTYVTDKLELDIQGFVDSITIKERRTYPDFIMFFENSADHPMLIARYTLGIDYVMNDDVFELINIARLIETHGSDASSILASVKRALV